MPDDWDFKREMQERRERSAANRLRDSQEFQRQQRREQQLVRRDTEQLRETIRAEASLEGQRLAQQLRDEDRLSQLKFNQQSDIQDLQRLAIELQILRQDADAKHALELDRDYTTIKGRLVEIIALHKAKKREAELDHELGKDRDTHQNEIAKDFERFKVILAHQMRDYSSQDLQSDVLAVLREMGAEDPDPNDPTPSDPAPGQPPSPSNEFIATGTVPTNDPPSPEPDYPTSSADLHNLDDYRNKDD